MDAHAGPSQLPRSSSALTPRQREKAPVSPDVVTLPPSADHEITLLIGEYLAARHPRLADVLATEIGPTRDSAVRSEIDTVERSILDGDFGSLESLLANPALLSPQTQRAFLYMCWRQQFLEFVDNRESQKAFNVLQKRLKPLEHYQPVPYDFYSLAYLTSASTVHDAPGLRDWAGAGPERERLVTIWRELTERERRGRDGEDAVLVPRDRLVTLLKQATAWQVANAGPSGPGPWAVTTLMRDYHRPSVPCRLEQLITGHKANVKCVDFIGVDGTLGVSGSSDTTLRIFSLVDGKARHVLSGHASRIWDVSASPLGSLVASGSGDGTVRLWSLDGECRGILAGDGGDVYGVRWRPGREDHVVTASYDKILRSWDVEAGKLVRTFSGHEQSTLAVAFDPTGKVIASGSKDKHIRLWDAVGGVCVQTMTAHLGEITSVEFDHEGKYLLAGCRDNSNRLWDLRMQRNIYRYTGHQNSTKNIVRCAFTSASSSIVASGSEDGLVYLWEREGSLSTPEENMRGVGAGASISPAIAFGPSPTLGSTAVATGSMQSPALAAHAAEPLRSSPAYYPPRDLRSTVSGGTPPTMTSTVRPLNVLAGHGMGAVFDVRGRAGALLSAGEDGSVGVWGDDQSDGR